MCRLLVLLVFVNCVHVAIQNAPYNFRPHSRHVEINTGENFYIGFQENKAETIFGHCYIESDIIKTDYPIFEKTQGFKVNKKHFDNGFSPFDGTSICAFTFHGANEQTPTKWVISVYDNQTKENFTETVTVSVYNNMPLFKDKLIALPMGSVANFFYSEVGKFKKCVLSFNNISVDLDLAEIKIVHNSVFGSRLLSLGEGKCGYKILDLHQKDSTDLTLYAADYNDKNYRNSSVLFIRKVDNLSNRTLEVYIGSRATVICGKKSDGSANSDQKFCYLYHPNGDLVSSQHMCYYELDVVTIEDLGIWKCIVAYDFIMDTLEFTTELIEKKPESVATFQEDSQNYHIIGCQLMNFHRYNLNYCKFTRPDGKIFKVINGGATKNYNTFSTELNRGKCSLEILKPLHDEDKGTWKCEAILSPNEIAGGFITVEKITAIPYKTSYRKNVRLYRSLNIECVVPYSSDFCYIIAPNGTQFRPTNPYQITSGVCSFKIEKVTSTDNGTWVCSIAQKNGVPDEMIRIEISIIDLKILHSNVIASENQNVDLYCNTNGIPIEYCRFVSPSVLSYSLRKDNSTYNGISYVGRGLEHGDCGIRISHITIKDHGEWACHISSGKNHYKTDVDLAVQLQLTVKPLFGLIETLGVSFGVLVIVICALAVVYIHCLKTKTYDKSIQYSVRPSIVSSEDDNDSLAGRENFMYATYRRQGYSVNE